MRFIFAHDGTAINVHHIVTIFIHSSSKPEGFVVRCNTVLLGGEFVNQHGCVNLSPILSDRATAETWLSTILQKVSPV